MKERGFLKAILCLGVFAACTPRPCSGAFDEVVLGDNPVAYYRFEEEEGAAAAVDATGNGHDSKSLANVVFGQEGLVGKAALFQGDAYIVLNLQMNPADSEGDGAGTGRDDFSIEAVVNVLDHSAVGVLLSQQNGTGTGRSIVTIGAGGNIQSFLGGGNSASTVNAVTNTYYHIVLTYDGGKGAETIRFYVNGEFAGSSGRIAEPATGDWVVGAHKSLKRQFLNGLVDELAFYNYRLDDPNGDDDTSDSRIAAHFQAMPLLPCRDLGLVCRFTDGGNMRLEFSTQPSLCLCSTFELSLDGEQISSGSLPQEGFLETGLPDPCEPGALHIFEAACTPEGVTASWAFRCPGRGEAYSEAVLADNPLAYLRFEETEGDTLSDVSGNGHDSVEITGAVLGVAGSVGNALYLNGLATVELNLQLNPADSEGDGVQNGENDWSVELFIRPDAITLPNVILAQQDGTGLGRSNLLLTQTEGGLIGSFLGGATTPSVVAPEVGRWYHVVMTYDGRTEGDNIRFYVNGLPAGSGRRVAEAADGNWVIGAHKNKNNSFFKGVIDELSFYSYRLDDPNGDDDISDSRVPFHWAAATGSEPPCTLLQPTCEAKPDGTVEVTLSGVPEGCFCSTVEVSIDDQPAGTFEVSAEGKFTVPLPEDCAPKSEHTLSVSCPGSVTVESCTFTCPGVTFKRGDINVDGKVDIADPVSLLSHLFAGAPEPVCKDAADANDDGTLDIGDPITILGHLFAETGPLAEPFEACGVDPTDDDLDCGSFPPCE